MRPADTRMLSPKTTMPRTIPATGSAAVSMSAVGRAGHQWCPGPLDRGTVS
jgi:hypothetical protein